MPQGLVADHSFASLLLALQPSGGEYIHPVKVSVLLLGAIVWAHHASWVQQDTKQLRSPQALWVPLTCLVGASAWVLWLILPVFWLGLLAFLALHGGVMAGYIVQRNARVAPAQKVLTPAHFQRLLKGKKPAEVEIDARDRTRIKDSNGKTPPWPTQAAERTAYQAFQDLLFDAIWRRATDVRLDFIGAEAIKVIYRIDGVDRARDPIDGLLGPPLLACFKRIAGMNPDEHRKPQAGSFRAAIGAGGKGDRSADVDVKTSGSTAGQRVVLKMVYEESRFRLVDVGFTKAQLPLITKLVHEHKGVMLVSGPRASGVTGTLYAMLREHDAFLQNIHALELTKAMEIENITQHLFDSQEGVVTFGKRLKSILRSEPDVCMVSDMVDTETASLVAAAGRQGKKIYLGISAKDTVSALRSYLAGVGDNNLAAAGLLAITSQRLLRVLCTNCRRAYKPDPAILKKANLPTGENRPFYRPPNPNEIETDKQGNPVLCAFCQGAGYLGRTGVFELLVLDEELRSHLAKGTPLPNLKVEARKKGMLYLQEVALHKVYEGITSINEVLRVKRESEPAVAAAS